MSSIYKAAFAVTPHDTNPNVYDALLIGGAGAINVKTASGEDCVIPVVAGQFLELGVVQVYSASTDATDITGLRR